MGNFWQSDQTVSFLLMLLLTCILSLYLSIFLQYLISRRLLLLKMLRRGPSWQDRETATKSLYLH